MPEWGKTWEKHITLNNKYFYLQIINTISNYILMEILQAFWRFITKCNFWNLNTIDRSLTVGSANVLLQCPHASNILMLSQTYR